MNDLASAPLRPASLWLRTFLFGLLGAGAFGYAVFLWRQVSPVAGGADSSGYLNSARLFSEGRLFTSPRVSPDFATGGTGANAYVPVGFTLRGDGCMVPLYPMGYPLQLLVSAGFGWSRAVAVLNVFTALASGCLFFAVGRQLGLSVGLALGGVALLWACPLFILPAFPSLIAATLVVLEVMWRKYQARRRLVAVGLALFLLAGMGWELEQVRRLEVLRIQEGERPYLDSARWAQRNLPAQSGIFCMQVSGAYFYYTNFVLLRWDQIVPEQFSPLLQAIARQDRPVYAALFPFETSEALKKIGGNWTQLATVGQVTFWQRQP